MTQHQQLILKKIEHLKRMAAYLTWSHEQIGKTMRAVTIEEEEIHEPFGAVLSFMEKLGILDSAMRWKLIRELRNAINHEYEENTARLTEFFTQLAIETPTLTGYAERLIAFCEKSYRTI